MFIGYYRTELPVSNKLSYNYLPFRTICYMFSIYKQHWVYSTINLIGNVVVFVPIGFFLPAVFERLRKFNYFTFTFISIIIVLELAQMFLHMGTADIDDLILNYPGGLFGFFLFRYYYSRFSIKK